MRPLRLYFLLVSKTPSIHDLRTLPSLLECLSTLIKMIKDTMSSVSYDSLRHGSDGGHSGGSALRRQSSRRPWHRVGLWIGLLIATAVVAQASPATVPHSEDPLLDGSQDAATGTSQQATPKAPPPYVTLDAERFPVPPSLQPNVDFWTKVYSEFDNDTVLLHDERHLQVIYAAIDLSELMESDLSDANKRRRRRQEIRKVEGKYHSILKDLAAGRDSKSYPDEQARVEALFASVPGNRSKYTSAQDRLRTQTCLRNRFAEAIERSGVYMDRIEAIFEAKGLPQELTRLPFVESLFQWNARSSAAAGGIWQFVPGTARLYMNIETEYDERFDPLRATHAAAELLGDNFEALQTWPLAITAYNHGRYGMQRAVRRLGTRDLGRIADEYRSRTFGFASRNFYSEFIAAAQVYANRDHLFPGVEPREPITFDDFVADRYVDVRHLARAANTDLDVLAKLNPSFSKQVWSGSLFLPKNYGLRIPAGQKQVFDNAYASLAPEYTSNRQVGFHYRVRPGDTLGKIARKYGTSIRAVQQANRLASPNRIRVGQKLLIPPSANGSGARRSNTSTQVARQSPSTRQPSGTYVVRPGDTLGSIARRHGTTARRLMALNGLSSPDRINVGQSLQLGGSADAGGSHVVKRGDTLASIAQRYGTTVRALQRANRISNHIIRPDQVLVIPR